ncbi:putative GABA transporter [Annulohypoxylon stygium]|nr:putative GABA transporter [Annulohypoxylon stygium]
MSKDFIEPIELRLPAQSNTMSFLTKSENSSGSNQDDIVLRQLGKRPLLNRSFGFMSILGLACSAMCSWEGILVTSVPTFSLGGPAAVVWAFVLGWIGTISVTATMAELASVAPTAGGQYHWIAMIAPESCSAFLTYVTAWLTTLAWQAMAITSSYTTSTILLGIVVLANPTYTPVSWHTILTMWATTSFAVLMNLTGGRMLAKFEGLILVLHLAGFFGILVPMVYFAPHNPPEFVFTTLFNNGNWPTQGLSFLVGFPTVATALIGADCAVHMSEEIQSASIVVPRALMYSIFINGALAFAIIVGLMFCISDLDAAVEAANTMFYSFLEIFQTAVKSTTGACLMAGIIFVLSLASSISVYASASRMMWSFSRDKGLPLSTYLVRLTKDRLPMNSILLTTAITLVLSLMVLAPSIALSALLSLVVAALYSSYLLVSCLLLWRRCTGGFKPYTPGIDIHDSGSPTWGPWKLPEPLGTINNIFACMYSALLLFWSFWPQTTDPTPETFNWSVLVFGFVLLSSISWYTIKARHYFKGPIKEV